MCARARSISGMMLRLPHVSFVFILLFAFHCKSTRVKHSQFEPDWQIPDDEETDWPSPDQIYFGLGKNLDGNYF